MSAAGRTELMPVRFSLADADLAGGEWGANCGPGAVAAATGMTLSDVRPFLGDFEQRGYMNPTLMWQVLDRLGVEWHRVVDARPRQQWESDPLTHLDELRLQCGLVRIQWHGPWMAPNVPRRARYRHTHWIATYIDSSDAQWVFDINCMCVGGWVSVDEWMSSVAPWLIRECCPKGDGTWSITDIAEISSLPEHVQADAAITADVT